VFSLRSFTGCYCTLRPSTAVTCRRLHVTRPRSNVCEHGGRSQKSSIEHAVDIRSTPSVLGLLDCPRIHTRLIEVDRHRRHITDITSMAHRVHQIDVG